MLAGRVEQLIVKPGEVTGAEFSGVFDPRPGWSRGEVTAELKEFSPRSVLLAALAISLHVRCSEFIVTQTIGSKDIVSLIIIIILLLLLIIIIIIIIIVIIIIIAFREVSDLTRIPSLKRDKIIIIIAPFVHNGFP